jgi:hypothetical protein
MAPAAGGWPGFLLAASDEAAAGRCLRLSGGDWRSRVVDFWVVIMSACPQDLTPVNGAVQRPADVHFQVHDHG